MKYRNSIIFLVLFLAFSLQTFALSIKVRVLSEYPSKTVIFKVESGSYMVLCDNNKVFAENLSAEEAITLTYHENKIRVEKGLEFIGAYSQIEFIGTKYNNTFSLFTQEMKKKRVYEEHLTISVSPQKELLCINRIDLEKYISGVVQSEVFGSSKDIEFFKIQATISRTYCLVNLNRHIKGGYNLCDAVHCQSYKGKCTSSDVLRGTFESFSDVVVDSTNRLITTAYYSNSGGMTESAGNVWQVDVPYLTSTMDTFSVGARNYLWKKSIPKQQWIDFFIKNYGQEYKTAEKQEIIFNFSQPQRIAKWIIENDTIPTKDIRHHFKLRSSYFSVVNVSKDSVFLEGKGYGHGVGLSQEGAIEMVKRGYTYIDILRFYYNNVNVIKYTDIIDF